MKGSTAETAARHARIVKLREHGMSMLDIAVELDLAEGTVWRCLKLARVAHFKVPNPNQWPKDRLERLIQLLAEGKSFSEAAKILRVSKHAVAGRVLRMGGLQDAVLPAPGNDAAQSVQLSGRQQHEWGRA